MDEPVPQIAEQAVRVTPHNCVMNRTPDQLVEVPVPQITEEIVEKPVLSERIHGPVVEQIRGLSEAVRRFCEQNAHEEEDDEEEEISRFPPHFRPRLCCQFLLAGRTCPHGVRCTFAHHESELHPDSWECDLAVGDFVLKSGGYVPSSIAWVQGLGIPWTLLGCPCRSPGQVKYTGGTGSRAWHPLTPSWVPSSGVPTPQIWEKWE